MTDQEPSTIEGYNAAPEEVSRQEYSVFIRGVKQEADNFPMGQRPPPQWHAVTNEVLTYKFEVFLNGWHLVAEAFDQPKHCHIYTKRWDILRDIASRHAPNRT